MNWLILFLFVFHFYFCVCFKSITLRNCFSSSSSFVHHFLAITGNSEQKSILQTFGPLMQYRFFVAMKGNFSGLFFFFFFFFFEPLSQWRATRFRCSQLSQRRASAKDHHIATCLFALTIKLKTTHKPVKPPTNHPNHTQTTHKPAKPLKN